MPIQPTSHAFPQSASLSGSSMNLRSPKERAARAQDVLLHVYSVALRSAGAAPSPLSDVVRSLCASAEPVVDREQIQAVVSTMAATITHHPGKLSIIGAWFATLGNAFGQLVERHEKTCTDPRMFTVLGELEVLRQASEHAVQSDRHRGTATSLYEDLGHYRHALDAVFEAIASEKPPGDIAAVLSVAAGIDPMRGHLSNCGSLESYERVMRQQLRSLDSDALAKVKAWLDRQPESIAAAPSAPTESSSPKGAPSGWAREVREIAKIRASIAEIEMQRQERQEAGPAVVEPPVQHAIGQADKPASEGVVGQAPGTSAEPQSVHTPEPQAQPRPVDAHLPQVGDSSRSPTEKNRDSRSWFGWLPQVMSSWMRWGTSQTRIPS